MAKLTSKQREKLPAKDFAIDGAERRYPIHDIAHARNALARVSAFGTPKEKAVVRRAVYNRYPELRNEVGTKMATKKKEKGTKQKPVLTISRFESEHEAEDYADNMTTRLGEDKYSVFKPKGTKGVTLLHGVRRPAVLVVTPNRKMPRITPKMRKLR